MHKNRSGFTIVELLIVIAVIGILAAITIVAYNGIQNRAKTSKINSDLSQIQKAIFASRINKGGPLYSVHSNGGPEAGCINKTSNTDLATLNKSTDTCWTAYIAFVTAVSDASGINIKDIVDPWGRPYYVNPNEDENTTTHVCMNDYIGTYSQPFVSGSVTNMVAIPLYKSTCA